MKVPAMSLIIPAYNEEKRIYKTLMCASKAARIFELETGNYMEIIVVDNNSDDKTIEIAKGFDVTIVHEEKHLIAAVRNAGAKAAKGDILCFLDADSEVSENIFILIYNAMIRGCFIGGGVKMKLDNHSIFYRGLSLGALIMSYVTGISGVLIYTQKNTFQELGGFDEKYYAGEDLKFIFSLNKEAKKRNQQFKNIYDGYVITSSRKFRVMGIKDIFLYVALLLNKNLMQNPEYCYPWYDLSKRGD